MSVKRSRFGRSSSVGETELLNHVSSPAERMRSAPSSTAKPAKLLKPSLVENTEPSPQKNILNLASPVRESVFEESDKEKIGGFLEKCYYCKKKMKQNVAVFMYSYLRAFCTAECRNSQIALDKKMEKQLQIQKW